ncbi:MAG: NADH-quinone oxidoreductase subunit H [Candidatus Caenarcaniphilales bacterium]|nr:NADH-quinone oxidoreductase subunit H [Candidatus Caenarcaniphilales bacterium]
MEAAQSQNISESALKQLFSKQGNLNILQNYRGERRVNKPVLSETIKFLLVIGFWIGAAFGSGVAAVFGAITATSFIVETYNLPSWIAEFAVVTSPLAAVMLFVPVNAKLLVLLERKLLSLLTTRLGPNRVGPNGLLQTLADALKLLFKEDIVPDKADKVLFFLAPALFFTPSVIAFLPIMSVAGDGIGPFAKIEFPTSLLFIIAVSSLAVMGLIMAGWASNNKYSLMGGLRSAAQAISYEIPFVLSLVAFVILSGSLNLKEIADSQAGGLLDWNIFAAGSLLNIENYSNLWSIPLLGLLIVLVLAIAFLIYFCSLAEVNRIPFDLPEAESELVSGYNTEFTGMKFALFFLAEYTNLFIVSTVLAILFFGGPYIGIPFIDEAIRKPLLETPLGNLSWLPGTFILLNKCYLFIALAIWIRATLPRFRSDQLMGLAWKVLIPISLVVVLLAAVCKTFLVI